VVTHMSPRDLKPGQWVDGFRIIRRIGQGYFGLVFEVEKEGQRFALKFASHREGSGDAAQTDARIERELICSCRSCCPRPEASPHFAGRQASVGTAV
jgi:hypothetical protein